MHDLKEQYNAHLKRFNKACEFLDTATAAEAEKWTPQFNKLCQDMSICINSMDKSNVQYTEEELRNGFK